MEEVKVYNTDRWVEENKSSFLPPVCNKMMHGENQMKCFFVGGPNVRKDYHIEEGPEFFHMVNGNMVLKLVELDKHKDVVIKEGEVFMLPPRIPHSPQRQAETVGLVIERKRLPDEMDGLRYFVEKDGEKTNEVLYESWFHCVNLGPQLAGVINAYFETEQYKTGVPVPGTIKSYDERPVKVDLHTQINAPFSLQQWMEDNRSNIEAEGSVDLFGDLTPGTHVKVYGAGETSMTVENAEVFIWVLAGSCVVEAQDKTNNLVEKDSLWLPVNISFCMKVAGKDSRILLLYIAPPPQ